MISWFWASVFSLRRHGYSMVSGIVLDERRKWICCCLCIYLQPLKANILWGSGFSCLCSLCAGLEQRLVHSCGRCSVLLQINICVTSWPRHKGNIIHTLNTCMKSILVTVLDHDDCSICFRFNLRTSVYILLTSSIVMPVPLYRSISSTALPKCIESLPCDWLICEQVYLII